MRYIGSKTSSLGHVAAALKDLVSAEAVVCDPFAGTCTVARHLKAEGFAVVTGDRLHASAAIQRAYVRLNVRPNFSGLKKHLNGASLGYGADAAVIEYL